LSKFSGKRKRIISSRPAYSNFNLLKLLLNPRR
jgi:hypothetical protein